MKGTRRGEHRAGAHTHSSNSPTRAIPNALSTLVLAKGPTKVRSPDFYR